MAYQTVNVEKPVLSQVRSSKVCVIIMLLTCLALLYYLEIGTYLVNWTSLKGSSPSRNVVGMSDLDHVLSTRFLELESILREIKAEVEGSSQKRNMTQSEEVKPSVVFQKRDETSHVDCGRILNGDIAYTTLIATKRPALVPKQVDTSCEAIRKRVMPPIPMRSLAFGVAYARIVYKDYTLIEDELRSSYHPQNFFCYSIDRKSDKDFHDRIKQLAVCFPNVIIVKEEFNVDNAGHFMNHAFYKCMQLLATKSGWGYLLLLQNHDVITKSPYEMVEIYRLLGGANDVEITPCPEGRWNHSREWDARSLKLFVNESSASPTQLNATLKFAKGATQASLSRAAVEWLVNTVNLTTLISQINEQPFGVDEILIQSLQITDELDMPGRFTSECLKQGKNTDFISRMSHWMYGGQEFCRSRKIRRAICVLGIEDLQLLSKYPTVMANKMLPDFDYAIVDCIHEMIFNRTFLNQIDYPLDSNYYRNMVNNVSGEISPKSHESRHKLQTGMRL
uniref:Core-2/I-Branching enzyme n=1 Tax=Haemonchus contortus TaxID=6289 RepID=A0A7I4Y5E6_HAECO